MLDFFYDVEENGEVAIDVLAVIVALLCVFIARFFATPGVYAKKSQYFQLPGLTLKFVDDAAKVCLLYTSPSPRDRTRARMPSSA